ncbi:MAG: hydroxyethylthiazole kinase [Propionibacteriaceae bacterium]|jgi:hydroxyethylthiazole kinase|nr:hydroxyethylthiazole kinase [Propionibacteriaceae bacterium]
MELAAVAGVVGKVRQQRPLVHTITNYVTVNDVANVLLSFGAAPAMVETFDEAYDFALLASAVYLNLGTLTPEQEAAGTEAILGAASVGTPVVVDPVALGAVPHKERALNHLLKIAKPSIIKGNGGEILSLAGVAGATRGVDAAGELAGLEAAAVESARRLGCVIAATGKVDVVTDGLRLARIHNGHKLLTAVSGTGCMAGALVAAATAVEPDPLLAAVAGIAAMGIAGELAAQASALPGSFRVALIDSIYQVDSALFQKMARVDVQPC